MVSLYFEFPDEVVSSFLQFKNRKMARAQGVEPRLSGPEPDVLPLDDARTLIPIFGNS